MKKDTNTALGVLTCAAMSLPGMLPEKANAEAPPDKHTVSYRFTQYTEGDQEQHALSSLTGALPRYDISVHQFQISGPSTKGKAYSVGVATESMTGASPLYVRPVTDESGETRPVQVMSGASIEEQRTDLSVGFDIYGSESKSGFGFGTSQENDYSSISFSINHASFFDNKNTTFSLSTGVSFDTIEPTDAGVFVGESDERLYPLRPIEENKQSLSASVGLSRVINKDLLLGSSINYVVYNGYLSDPYKQAYIENHFDDESDSFVAGAVVGDSRPDVRRQAALNLQARWFVNATNSALHTDYRLFSTDWGTISNTLNVAWFQNFGKIQVIPRLRLYNQTAANFYRNYYLEDRADGYYSSDYRLSEYQALSFRIKAQYNFRAMRLHASYENYVSGSGNSDPQRGENPGLVDFSFFSLGADVRF